MSSRNRRSWITLTFLVLLLAIASCWPWRKDPGDWTTPRTREIGLEVRSQNFQDVVLYIYSDGQRRRLEMVTGLTTESFDLTSHPGVLHGTFQLTAEPIGSRDAWMSGLISVFPGDVVVVTLTSQIRMSHWYIR